MLEQVLVRKNLTTKKKITVKSLISTALIILALVLPQVFHLVGGAKSGMIFLPMYLPILLGGLLLGVKWGLGVAIISPILSFIFTSLAGSPMPALSRLPFMVAELAVFALVSGLFSKLIAKNALYVIPAVILAILCGRGSFLFLVWIFDSVSSLSINIVLQQVRDSLYGILIQLTVIPLIVLILSYFLNKEKTAKE